MSRPRLIHAAFRVEALMRGGGAFWPASGQSDRGAQELTESWMSDSGPSLLVRTAAVTVVVVGFFAIATGVIPVRCWIGGACDGAKTEKTVAVLPTTETPAAASAASVEPVAAKAAPTLTSNDVIAGTFAQLKVELNPPTRLPATTAPVQVAAAAPSIEPPATTITNPETGLNKRVVRAVSIRADGTPEMSGSVAEAYAPGPRIALAPPSPAVDAAARIGAGQRPAVETQTVADLSPDTAADAPPPAKSTPAVKSGQATVTGKGANVRAAPSKAGKVLFALGGGKTVTIVGSKRGWMQVKDDQGRTGWMYGDALKRG